MNRPYALFAILFLAARPAHAAPAAGLPFVPPDSAVARDDAGLQRLLLNACAPGANITPGGWRLEGASVQPAPAGETAKLGRPAVTLRGQAAAGGSKGDFVAAQWIPGKCRRLGLWVCLPPNANVDKVGFQVYDSEGEALMWVAPAPGEGWHWIEADLAAGFQQAYPQADKNGKADMPLRSVNVVWFAKEAGQTALTIGGLVAATELAGPPPRPALSLDAGGDAWSEPGQAVSSQLLLTNRSDRPAKAQVAFSIQRDPGLYSQAPPDPLYGTDRALGARSWTECEGKRIEEGSLTDGKNWTAAELPWDRQHYAEAFQFVDLGRVRQVTHLAWRSGDANWVWRVDVDASVDGTTFRPVPELQDFDMHGKWGVQAFPDVKPFAARVLRFRYHNHGQKSDVIRMPAALSVYCGTAGETWAFPATGETVAQGTTALDVPARSFAATAIGARRPLSPGAYLVAARVQAGGSTQLAYRHLFVIPPAMKAIPPDSRFGLNGADISLAERNRRLGVGWLRFENMKWPMMSPAPGEFRYDGSVAPWHVNADALIDAYAQRGIQVLPYLFLTPEYATTAPADAKKQRLEYPPKDNAAFAEFCFQTAARYGARKHPADALKTPDHVSGKGQVRVYEIWNEPTLNSPDWGAWIAPLSQYFELFRAASEAVKRADPAARVSHAGWAGIDVASIDKLRSYTYADGKHPLDFTDVLNVHYYTGQSAPEQATVNTNVNRAAGAKGARTTSGQRSVRTYEDELRSLVSWRDDNKPGLPIWLTETGYDTGGPRGVDERLQAAWLPRDVMLALGCGIEKVFVYRESGSTDALYAASGLVANDGSLRPSWLTYATLIRELDGVREGWQVPTADPNVRLYAWRRGKETILSAWAIEGTAKLKLNVGRCTLTDAFGGRRPADTAAGVPLGIFPVYLSGMTSPAAADALVEKGRQAEAARRQQQARQARLRAYLFDFGSTENVGFAEIGKMRQFTPVLAKETFDAAKGYGFQPAALQDDDQAWRGDPLTRDSCKVAKGIRFLVAPAPGRYRLTLCLEPFQEEGRVLLSGAAGGDQTLTLRKKEPMAETTVTVPAGGKLSLESDFYANLRWLTLVEEP